MIDANVEISHESPIPKNASKPKKKNKIHQSTESTSEMGLKTCLKRERKEDTTNDIEPAKKKVTIDLEKTSRLNMNSNQVTNHH